MRRSHLPFSRLRRLALPPRSRGLRRRTWNTPPSLVPQHLPKWNVPPHKTQLRGLPELAPNPPETARSDPRGRSQARWAPWRRGFGNQRWILNMQPSRWIPQTQRLSLRYTRTWPTTQADAETETQSLLPPPLTYLGEDAPVETLGRELCEKRLLIVMKERRGAVSIAHMIVP